MKSDIRPESRRQLIIGLLLGAIVLAALLYLSGLAATLPLGDSGVRGFLLVPALPTPMYVTMLAVVLAAVGLSLLVSILQRRGPRSPEPQREPEAPKPFWQSMLTILAWVALVGLGLNWLIRHGREVQEFLERIRFEVGAIREALEAGILTPLDHVSSPTAGYTLFVIVVAIYGGIALVALWVLFEDGARGRGAHGVEDPQLRQVRRAMQAGLRELRAHADPRQAIIACYAQLEYLLEDHGVPAYRHLTPQEYMGAALRGLDLPQDAFAGLIRLFELARYSLHPLDDAERIAARAHLERLTTHVEGIAGHAARG
jgi:Domain of unknown function (DUF4129)